MRVRVTGIVLAAGFALAGCSSTTGSTLPSAAGSGPNGPSSAGPTAPVSATPVSAAPATACTLVQDSVRDADLEVQGYVAMNQQAEDVEKALDVDVAAIRAQARASAKAAEGTKSAAMTKVAADVASIRGAVTVNLDLQAPLEVLSADLNTFNRACFGAPRSPSPQPSS